MPKVEIGVEEKEEKPYGGLMCGVLYSSTGPAKGYFVWMVVGISLAG